MLPFVAGALLVLVALIHRSLSSSEPVQGSPLAGPKAAAVLAAPRSPAAPRADGTPPGRAVPPASTSTQLGGSADLPVAATPPGADPQRPSAGDTAARMIAAARSKVHRSKVAPTPRETTRAPEASVAPSRITTPEPAVKEAAASESAPSKKPRARLVDDGPRPGLLD
jgi:hypothetical protein